MSDSNGNSTAQDAFTEQLLKQVKDLAIKPPRLTAVQRISLVSCLKNSWGK